MGYEHSSKHTRKPLRILTRTSVAFQAQRNCSKVPFQRKLVQLIICRQHLSLFLCQWVLVVLKEHCTNVQTAVCWERSIISIFHFKAAITANKAKATWHCCFHWCPYSKLKKSSRGDGVNRFFSFGQPKMQDLQGLLATSLGLGCDVQQEYRYDALTLIRREAFYSIDKFWSTPPTLLPSHTNKHIYSLLFKPGMH